MRVGLNIDPRILPEESERIDRRRQTQKVKQHLEKKAIERKRQTDKHEAAKEFQPNDQVWIKLHRRSDANRKTTRKIHLVYQGPHRVSQIIRKNAYLIETLEGDAIGVYNTRQLRPHREATMKTIGAEEPNQNNEEPNILMISVVPLRNLQEPLETKNKQHPKSGLEGGADKSGKTHIELQTGQRNKGNPITEIEIFKNNIQQKKYLPYNTRSHHAKRQTQEEASIPKNPPEKKKKKVINQKRQIGSEIKTKPITFTNAINKTEASFGQLTRDDERCTVIKNIPAFINIRTWETRPVALVDASRAVV